MKFIDMLVHYKWAILLGLEVLAWASTFFMLYARYRANSQLLFRIGAVLTVCTGVIPQVLLGIVNFVTFRKLDLFTGIIVLLILYGSTIGRGHVKKLDRWAQRKFARKDGMTGKT
ncbi:hypothetical protein LJK88_05775 [Paenibacillus sp. P26]|nr:hypothetical protein LJK88_05775 [Paenibacillus sp. P26]UUZ90457.1 hypothetical protein LJK87_31730 [Paenibacillus sp. P25]